MGRVSLGEQGRRRRLRRPRLPRLRIPTVVIPGSRSALIAALAVAAATAPDDWLRGLLIAGGLFGAYSVGWRDGRRDHALDLLRDRLDHRGSRPTSSGGQGAQDGIPA